METRRAEEMREVARTVAEAGLEPLHERRHSRTSGLGAAVRSRAQRADLGDMLDAIRAMIGRHDRRDAAA